MAEKLEKQALIAGRNYRLIFVDGKAITGKLVEVDRYTLLLDNEENG